MLLETHRKIYQTRFGLKGLIILLENPELVMAKDIRFFLYAGLITLQPDITLKEINEIIQECNLQDFSLPDVLLNKYEIKELYTKAVGEIGITPTDFYLMTPEEIDMAYEGYLRRKETEANLFKIAISSRGDGELIRLTEDKGYSVGNLQERKEVFKILHLQERNNNEL